MIEHKGYIGGISDLEGGIFHGRVVNIRDVVSFEGKTGDELERAFRDSVEDYISMCEEEGIEPQRGCSGQFRVRMTPELHRRAHEAAALAEKSLNTLVVEAVEDRVANRNRRI